VCWPVGRDGVLRLSVKHKLGGGDGGGGEAAQWYSTSFMCKALGSVLRKKKKKKRTTHTWRPKLQPCTLVIRQQSDIPQKTHSL
jgi:hypothetical protein